MNRSLKYLLLNFGMAWSLMGLVWLFDLELTNPLTLVILALAMLSPGAAAFLTHKNRFKGDFVNFHGIHFVPKLWYIPAWVGPVLFVIASIFLSVLVFSEMKFVDGIDALLDQMEDAGSKASAVDVIEAEIRQFPRWGLFFFSAFSGLMAGVTLNAVFAFGEELGWRGFLQREWSGLGFWKSNLLIGVVWGIWHLPIILRGYNYGEDDIWLGAGMMIAFCTLSAPLFGYIRVKTGSVIAPSVMHGTLNGSAGMVLLHLKGHDNFLSGPMGLLGFGIMIFLLLLIVAFDRKNLQLEPLKAPPAEPETSPESPPSTEKGEKTSDLKSSVMAGPAFSVPDDKDISLGSEEEEE